MTRLAWLIKAATDASETSVKTAIEKLIYLRNMDAHTLDISALAAERRGSPRDGRRFVTPAR